MAEKSRFRQVGYLDGINGWGTSSPQVLPPPFFDWDPTCQQGQIVDCARIAAFFSTQIGKKLRTHPDVVREFKFSVLDDGENFSDELRGEKILLQGVVDCAMIDDDGITVIDFKTDYVTDATLADKLEQYRPQVKAYADAMQRIYQKPIKEALLYFFRVDQFVTAE